jgi:hypothetical protein
LPTVASSRRYHLIDKDKPIPMSWDSCAPHLLRCTEVSHQTVETGSFTTGSA